MSSTRNIFAEGPQSLLDLAMHHFAPSVLLDVPGVSFRTEEDHRRVQRELLAAEGGSLSADQQVCLASPDASKIFDKKKKRSTGREKDFP